MCKKIIFFTVIYGTEPTKIIQNREKPKEIVKRVLGEIILRHENGEHVVGKRVVEA